MGKETRFSGDNQPNRRRGKSERTKILESMKRVGKTEEGFYDLLVERAHNVEDQFSYAELLKRLSPIQKSVMPIYQFELNTKLDHHQQAQQVISAISSGEIPADVGSMLIGSITNMLKIKEVTDFENRLKALEESQNDQS